MLHRLKLNTVKYGAIAQINLQNSLAYAGELANRSLFMVLILYVFVQLWRATYSAVGAATIGGLSFADTLWYLVMTETIELSRARFANQMSDEVKDGSIAYTLGRPYNYLLYHWSYGLGDTLLRLAINFTAGTLLVTAMVGPMPLSPIYALPMLVTLMLAMALNFCIQGLIGLCAFFTEDVQSIQIIYQKFLFILGGMLIPLDFFPGWLKDVSLILPFNYLMYAPARLFVQFDWARWVNVVTMQVVWLGVFGLALWALFRVGLRHVSINGG
jgi:ABC-2 type transport system permease protein